ncbi:hypothetical protein QMO14_32350 [Variovorax sp. CAN2819]|uniref:hypothetical protein n=1 Tax=Variovorax sp. CAN15 TaxID=3046727 RepID=UPI0026486E89|nr:hypothetical protein [Variovorax sp. CAN15]MDN6888271.1 hypothetical protein [Variovorax sp. CAN15]
MTDPLKDKPEHALPAQKAMKQTAKTSSERGEGADQQAGRSERSQPARKGDAAVGTTENEGSSPYSDRSRKERAQRNE